VRVTAASVALPGATLTSVQVVAQTGQDGLLTVQLQAAKVSVPALGWRGVGLTVKGEPQRARDGAWQFVGHVHTRRAPGGALADADIQVLYDPGAQTLAVDLGQGKVTLHALMPLDQTSHVQMKVMALPLVWLRGVMSVVWPAGRLAHGTLSGHVALDLAAARTRVSGRVRIGGADLDSKAGNIAARGLGLAGSFHIDERASAASVLFDGRLNGGELLLGPLYAQLPSHAANLHLVGTFGAAGIRIGSLDYDDPGTLRLSGQLGFDRKGNLDRLDFKKFAATFPAAYQRYGAVFVQNLAGSGQWQTSGSIAGSLDMDASGLKALDLEAEDLSVAAPGGGFAVADLNGGIDWRAQASRPATTLRWNALSAYRLALGPAQLHWQDQAGVLRLEAPATATLFGGSFQLAHFAWRPSAGKLRRLSAAFSVTDVDLAALCKAFGWPTFLGKLGGSVPGLQYRDGQLTFQGGLSLQVFDGAVSVTGLSLRHPLGSTPELKANVDLEQLNLAQLSGAFDFGHITGRLNGAINGLQLVDWKPVAFAATLTTQGGGKISQDAIKNLSQVGGGGVGGGLQGLALSLFKTFHYAKIELSCTLAKGVCTMGGIEPDPNPDTSGYTIVEGSGLPHLTVIGHERKVDWATLVSRLESATHGKGPVVK
jgi:hypothetical protein